MFNLRERLALTHCCLHLLGRHSCSCLCLCWFFFGLWCWFVFGIISWPRFFFLFAPLAYSFRFSVLCSMFISWDYFSALVKR